MKKTGLLFSGGMDSYALTYQEKPDIVITIDYGQKPAIAEIRSAKILAKRLNIRHEIITIDLSSIGSGDLHGSAAIECAPASDWWPYRNQALITFSAMHLVSFGIERLLIATVKTDSTHCDGSKKFIEIISSLLTAQEGGMCVDAPAIHLSTTELVINSGIPYSLLAWAHSCHTENIACGQCRGCNKHREIVEELGYAKT